MKRLIRTSAALVGLAAWISHTGVASSQEERAPAETEANQPAPAPSSTGPVPQRKLDFREADDKLAMQFDPDDDLPRQRYAAVFNVTLKFPRIGQEALVKPAQTSYGGSCPPEIMPMVEAVGGWGFGGFGGMGGMAGQPQAKHPIQNLIDNVPEPLRPADVIVNELVDRSNPQAPTLISHMQMGMGGMDMVGAYGPEAAQKPQDLPPQAPFSHIVCAANPSRLEELVRALITIYDEGFARTCHRNYIAAERKIRDQLEEYRKVVNSAEQKLAGYEKQLEELSAFEDLSKETMASLTAQKRMIAVNLTGIKARLEACNKILADREKLSTSRIDQVETVKITAEIELVGLAAEEKAINDIIAAGRQRAELQENIKTASRDVWEKQKVLTETDKTLADYQKAIGEGWAYAEVGQITIQPIRWTPISKEK
jgi:hypothetical protein